MSLPIAIQCRNRGSKVHFYLCEPDGTVITWPSMQEAAEYVKHINWLDHAPYEIQAVTWDENAKK